MTPETAKINDSWYTSRTDEWATPRALFKELDSTYHFTLDPCATPENAKCDRYFTRNENGLSQSWRGRVFMNPPYGRDMKLWMRKAWEESKKNAELVVCLVPARTDTAWWHDYAMKGDITFIRGRLKYNDGAQSAPFPSAVVIFRKEGQ